MVASVPDHVLATVVDDLAGPSTVAIILGGSYVRGDATPFSDVDIAHVVTDASLPPERDYRYYGDLFICIVTRSLAWYRTAITQPERALFVVPSLREARVLFDTNYTFRTLQRELEAFSWKPLQAAADHYASRAVFIASEAVHKLLSAHARNDTETILTEAIMLHLGLMLAVAVHYGRLIDGTMSYPEHVQQAAGIDSAWANAHRAFIEVGAWTYTSPLAHLRGAAALRLYRETVLLLSPILHPDHLRVIEQTMRLVSATLDRKLPNR